MRGLRIEPVRSLAFRPERVAEGRIAVNDHRATPMFAPCTGRVTRALARAGDRVEAGAPLHEIETPEVAAEAEARSAAAQLDATRDRLRVLGRGTAEVAQIGRHREVSGLITVTAPLAGTVTQRRAGAGRAGRPARAPCPGAASRRGWCAARPGSIPSRAG